MIAKNACYFYTFPLARSFIGQKLCKIVSYWTLRGYESKRISYVRFYTFVFYIFCAFTYFAFLCICIFANKESTMGRHVRSSVLPSIRTFVLFNSLLIEFRKEALSDPEVPLLLGLFYSRFYSCLVLFFYSFNPLSFTGSSPKTHDALHPSREYRHLTFITHPD